MADVAQTVLLFVVMGGCCTGLERLWPFDPDAPRRRSDSGTDVLYFVLRIVLSGLLALVAGVAGGTLPQREPTWAGSLPFAVQLVAVLFLADLIQYWLHRIMHWVKPLWHIHAVHHSPEHIDWLVAARVHPFELGINKVLSTAPLYLSGFSPNVFAVAVPLAATYSLLLHSNLSWTYGPLGYILVSPAFHRWHHASDPLARDKNFAQTFSFIDYIFSTAYFPRALAPEGYGLVSGVMPRGIWGQFLYPIREWLWPTPPAAPGLPVRVPADGAGDTIAGQPWPARDAEHCPTSLIRSSPPATSVGGPGGPHFLLREKTHHG